MNVTLQSGSKVIQAESLTTAEEVRSILGPASDDWTDEVETRIEYQFGSHVLRFSFCIGVDGNQNSLQEIDIESNYPFPAKPLYQVMQESNDTDRKIVEDNLSMPDAERLMINCSQRDTKNDYWIEMSP